MLKYELLPSHIKYLDDLFHEYAHPRLNDLANDISAIATNFPNQAYSLDIFIDEQEPLYMLIHDEPIFAELARELEIEMASE